MDDYTTVPMSELSDFDVLLTGVLRTFENAIAERDGLERRRWVLTTSFMANMVELEGGAMRAIAGERDRVSMLDRIYESDQALTSQSNAVQLSALKILRLSNYVTTRVSHSHAPQPTTNSTQ